MDDLQLGKAAQQVAPFLHWMASTDGDGQLGSGLPFVGATVGTLSGPATVAITYVGGKWVCELTLHAGSVVTDVQKTIVLQTTGSETVVAAWESLLELADGAGSVRAGLDAAKDAWGGTTAGRLNAIGMIPMDVKVSR